MDGEEEGEDPQEQEGVIGENSLDRCEEIGSEEIGEGGNAEDKDRDCDGEDDSAVILFGHDNQPAVSPPSTG